jgi:hypothetical protein
MKLFNSFHTFYSVSDTTSEELRSKLDSRKKNCTMKLFFSDNKIMHRLTGPGSLRENSRRANLSLELCLSNMAISLGRWTSNKKYVRS